MNTAQNIGAKSITIKDIELHTEKRRKFLVARRFYVQFSVGETVRATDSTKETKNRTHWGRSLDFDGDDCSVLRVQVYQKLHVGKSKLVGSLSDTIGDVLGNLKDGVLEATLRKDTSDGPDLLGIRIKFVVVAEPRGKVNAEEHQAIDAVTMANATLSVHRSPAVIDTLGSAVSTLTNVQTYGTTWEVLLRRMKIFNNIVDGIAEIHPYASMAWSVISAASKILVAQKNRDDRIIHLAGVMSDVFTFVEDAEALKRIEAHKKILTLLISR
ncbi:hypothetical protein EV363DRAFT_241053 [Boletus edulis]|nr:hypothetical protein EV363DRAFT_241053 [Boletus edulis]